MRIGCLQTPPQLTHNKRECLILESRSASTRLYILKLACDQVDDAQDHTVSLDPFLTRAMCRGGVWKLE